MRASVIIPLWNGATVIENCLNSVMEHEDQNLHEIICVDNASEDQSAEIIAVNFPKVRLLRQTMNLGFAGGINAGIEAAQGDTFILLNQDTLVEADWLKSFDQAFQQHPEFGIAGCTLLNADGSINHAGAVIQHPAGTGHHLTEIKNWEPQIADYVTGAVFAIKQEAWHRIGSFDEGFYPAYFEEADYCYRARYAGVGVAYVPQVKVTHLFSSHEATKHPFRHAALQHRRRYRFICKHFSDEELRAFFEAEVDAVDQETYLNHVFGRLIGARDTLQGLPDINLRRYVDMQMTTSRQREIAQRQGFMHLAREALAKTQQLTRPLTENWENITEQEQELKQHVHNLLCRIYFRDPNDPQPESTLHRLWRLVVLRPLSFLTGRDYLLQAELNRCHIARFDTHQIRFQIQQDLIEHSLQLFDLFTDYEQR